MSYSDTALKLYNYQKGISFEDSSHTYYYKNRTMTSVTTAVGNCFPMFDRGGAISKNLAEKRGISVKDLKAEWRRKAELGTIIHLMGEHLVSGALPPVTDKSVSAEESVFVENCFRSIQEFYYNLKDSKVLFPEFIVYDGEFSVAGTCDLLVYNSLTGKIDIYDWKTNRSIMEPTVGFGKFGFGRLANIKDTNYWHYALQLSVYKYILEKNGFEIGGLHLVHITDTSYKIIDVPYLSDECLIVLEDNL
jgi:hypothetical protein